MNPKEKFLDRIEQSFIILTKNKDLVIWPVSISVAIFIFASIIWKVFSSVVVLDKLFFVHPVNFILLIVGLILILGVVFLKLGIMLGVIEYLKKVSDEKQISIQEALLSGMKKIGASMYTYYYVFAYTILIPALFFIVGLLLLLIAAVQSGTGGDMNSIYINTGIISISISMLLGIYFSIYRGVRSTFAIYRAVETEDFSRESFEKSLEITNGKWKRIFWNSIGLSILIGLIVSTINGFLVTEVDFSGLIKNTASTKEVDVTSIKHVLEEAGSISIGALISSIFQTIGWIFSITFTYIFFKRLEMETKSDNTEIQTTTSI